MLKKRKADLERAEIRLRAQSLDGVPFGDKALNEEPEIEGVWNSRASTPLQSPVLGPRSSSPSRISINMFSKSRRNSSISSLTNLTLPETTRVLHTPPETDNSSVAAISTGSTAVAPNPRRRSVTIRAMSTQDLTSTSAKNGTREEFAFPVSIANGILGEMNVCSSSSARTRKSRVSTDPGTSTPIHEHRGRTVVIGGSSTNSSSLERTPTTKKALARMEAHRKFHAAESGQLQPRSPPFEESKPRHKHTNSDSILPGHEAARAVSWPITPGEALIIDFNAPQKVQTMKSPPVVPFRAHIETHTTTKTAPSAWTNRTQGMLDEKLEVQDTKRKITTVNNDTGKPQREASAIANQKAAKKEEETVSLLGTQQRRVNSGFEILPAGTLYDEHFAEEFGFLKQPLRETSNETAKPRKLQKRNRSNSRDRRISVETMRRIIA